MSVPVPILVVDDSRTMVLTLARVLRKAGYHVITAHDGQEALAKLESGARPALILTDLNMPELDGLGLIREVRARQGVGATPIIVLTAETSESAARAARALGANGWLSKPAEQAVLLDAISANLALSPCRA
ncbi:response regulator [Acidocella sp.]|uniref:response regulator n=1 Tax=Acidocella sp. TaxID=50710 RepID=UPI002603600A|nr:response regulator [Acidocella sp.]